MINLSIDETTIQIIIPVIVGINIDKIVHFSPLGQQELAGITEKYLRQLKERAAAAGIRLLLPEDLAEKISTGEMIGGARGLRRLVQDRVEGPLAVFLLQWGKSTGSVRGIWESGVLRFGAES